ncbi:hypothetical protein EV127DRAFT_409775 [Xylaria flabelliformis]|nr:hypothetical protein EV127DRAFT_409775 [Xylaria flabelliformis]
MQSRDHEFNHRPTFSQKRSIFVAIASAGAKNALNLQTVVIAAVRLAVRYPIGSEFFLAALAAYRSFTAILALKGKGVGGCLFNILPVRAKNAVKVMRLFKAQLVKKIKKLSHPRGLKMQ